MNLGEVLSRFGTVKIQADKSHMAKCPAHEDKQASLHITVSGESILLKCFAGCSTEAVVSAVGLTLSDLFIHSNGHSPAPARLHAPPAPIPEPAQRKEVCAYDYKDAAGKLIYQVVRYDPKDFRQRRPDGKGGWQWDMTGVKRVLYHLDDLQRVTDTETIYVVEGEKDADNIWAHGGIATTSPGGAQAWKPEYSEHLAGKRVCIIPDMDGPGIAYAQQAVKSLEGKAKEVKVILLPGEKVKDVSDWLEAGGEVAGLPVLEKGVDCLEAKAGDIAIEKSKVSKSRVEQWIMLANGTFNVRQIWNELGVYTEADKSNLRVILHRLVEAGTIAKTALDGTYRKLDNEKKTIDWQSADPNKYIPIELPFGLHELCKVYPKSIIIVAGSKNEGKTAFLMSCLMPNVGAFPGVDFFNSETGPEQLKTRFEPLDIPNPAPFQVYERYDNFADVIEPTHLSVIDYLDLNAEVYMVGAEIDAIFRKLTTGVAIIGLQKPAPAVTYVKGVKKVIERDLAYGGSFSAKRAVIYISMSNHKLKLVYVKTPADPRRNPNNMMWKYDFNEDGYFTNIYPYQEGDPDGLSPS